MVGGHLRALQVWQMGPSMSKEVEKGGVPWGGGTWQYPVLALGAGLGHGPWNWTSGGCLQNSWSHGPLRCEVAKCVIWCSTRPHLWSDSRLHMPKIQGKFMGKNWECSVYLLNFFSAVIVNTSWPSSAGEHRIPYFLNGQVPTFSYFWNWNVFYSRCVLLEHYFSLFFFFLVSKSCYKIDGVSNSLRHLGIEDIECPVPGGVDCDIRDFQFCPFSF